MPRWSKTFNKCPKCKKKGLYKLDKHGEQICRYCKHYEPHGKHSIVVEAERYLWWGRQPTFKVDLGVESKTHRWFEEYPVTLDQLRAIADVLSPPGDRAVIQRHQHAFPSGCKCGLISPTVEQARECLGITLHPLEQLASCAEETDDAMA